MPLLKQGRECNRNPLRREACIRLLDLYGFDDRKLALLEIAAFEQSSAAAPEESAKAQTDETRVEIPRDVFMFVMEDSREPQTSEEREKRREGLSKLFDFLDTPDENGKKDGVLRSEELRSLYQGSPTFMEERRTAVLSLGFTVKERSKFLDEFMTQHTGALPFEMSATQLVNCWKSARGFSPSTKTVQTVCDAFRDTNGEVHIDALDFAQRCTGNRRNTSMQPLPLAFFSTQLEKHKDLAGLLYFLPFLTLFTYYLLSAKGLGTGYFLHVQNENMFVDESFEMPCPAPSCIEPHRLAYESITEPTEFYQWLREVLIPGLWNSDDGVAIAEGPLQHHVFPMGALRIETVRVNGSNRAWQRDFYFGSSTNPMVDTIFPNSSSGDLGLHYPHQMSCAEPSGEDYSIGVSGVDTTGIPTAAVDAFRYISCTGLTTDCINGAVGNYPCGGFNALIPFNTPLSEALAIVDHLEERRWLDIQTRAVFVHHVLFSKDTRLLYKSRLGFEVSASGQWLPLRRSFSFKYFSWEGKSAAWITFFALYALFVIGYIVKICILTFRYLRRGIANCGGELRLTSPIENFHALRCSFWTSVITERWLLYDVVTYAFFITVWVYRAVVWARTPPEPFFEIHRYSYHIDDYANDIQLINYLDCIVAFMLYFRLFKYFKLFRVLDCITRTVYMASYELLGVAFTFFVFVIAFSVSGYVLYSDVSDRFATVPKSMETLFRVMVGDFDYALWASTRRVVSPIFFALIFIFVALILFNSLVGILGDNFEQVVMMEFNSDELRALIERDPTCSLSFDKWMSWRTVKNNPIFHELLRAPRWVLRITGSEAHLGEDPRTFWYSMVKEVTTIYYGTREEAREVFFSLGDAAVKEEEESIRKEKEDSQIKKETSYKRQTVRDTLFAVHSAPTRPPTEIKLELGLRKSELTVWEALRNNFGVNLELFIVLAVHRPHVIMGTNRSALLVELVEVHANWKLEQRSENLSEDPAEEASHLREQLQTLLRQQSAITGAEARRTTTTDFTANRGTSLYSSDLDEFLRIVMARAFFSGMSKEDRRVTDYDAFMERWTRARQTWVDYQLAPTFHLEVDLIKKEVLSKAEFDKVKQFAEEAAAYDVAQVYKVGLRPSQRRRLIAVWKEMNAPPPADPILRTEEDEEELSTRRVVEFDPEKAPEVPKPTAVRKPEEEFGVGDMNEFAKCWESAIGAPLNRRVTRGFKDLSEVVLGDKVPDKVDLDMFFTNCIGCDNNHGNRSFVGHFYATQRKRIFNVTNLFLYIPFLAIVTFLLVTQYGVSQSTRMTGSIVEHIAKETFEGPDGRMTFDDIQSADEVYPFLRNVVARKLFRTSGGPAAFDGVNVLVGAVRVRQLRAAAERNCGYTATGRDSQQFAERIQQHFRGECVPSWGSASRSREPFGNVTLLSPIAAAAFEYSRCERTSNLFGDNAIYTCGGHSLVLPLRLTQAEAQSVIDELQAAQWITPQTRALIVEGFFYNFNGDIFNRAQFLLETTGGGYYVTGYRNDVFVLFKTQSFETAYFVLIGFFLALLILNIAFYVLYVVRTIARLKQTMSSTVKAAFLRFTTLDRWWMLELVNYSIFIAAWGMRFSRMVSDSSLVRIHETDEFPIGLIQFAEITYAIMILDTINALLCFIKVFRFMEMQPQLNTLWNALLKSGKPLIALIFMGFVILSGFAFAGHIVYGKTLFNMSDMGWAYESLVIAAIPGEGEDIFPDWYADRPVFTGFYFTLFVIAILILMSQMVTSIVAHAYGMSKEMQFDPRPVTSAIQFDPSIDGGSWWHLITRNMLVRELRYLVGKVSSISKHPSKSPERLAPILRNPRTFYSFMTNLVSKLEAGTPREAAVAAGELAYIVKVAIRVGRVKQDRGEKIENELLRREALKLFGVPRFLVRQYCYKRLPQELADTIQFWCVHVPTIALDVTRDELVVDTLHHLLPWEREAKTYCEIGENTEDETAVYASLKKRCRAFIHNM